MFDEKKLWIDRFGKSSRELGKYLKYIFNGHLVIVLFFLLGTAAFYYQEWIKTLSSDFPAAFIMAVLLSLLLTYSPIYTFLLEADRVFLLPLENKMKGYFSRSLIVSFLVHIYLLIMGLGILMPLYAKVNNGNFRIFFYFLILMSIIKGLNLLIRWRIQLFVDSNIHTMDSFIRYLINGVFLYLLFSNANLLFLLIVLVLFGLYYLYFQRATMDKGLKWELLISIEERRMMAFYRLANLFTDVPELRNRVKRRIWLDPIFKLIGYGQNQTYSHLFSRTFIRSGDYLGLFVRLTAICFIFLFFISNEYGQIFFTILFIYLTGFQLLPLWNHYQNKLWIQLYPVKESEKLSTFLKLLSNVLSIQALLISLAPFIQGRWETGLAMLAIGLLFSYAFVHVYGKSRIINTM